MNARPFRTVIVSPDRSLLRRLSRFLGAFGHHVMPLAETRQVRALSQYTRPDFLIIDGDDQTLQACQPLLSDAGPRHLHVLRLTDTPSARELTESLKMGVCDFLAKPVVLGELLARLRAGARFLEYERRNEQRAAVCPVTALLSESAFRERLAIELSERADPAAVHCVLMGIDLFDQFRITRGTATARILFVMAAEQLRTIVAPAQYLACMGRGRFAAMLAEPSETKVLAWAETVRETVAALHFAGGNEADQFTASLGIATMTDRANSASDLIESAAEALQLAQASGGDCVVRSGQFDDETRSWENLARAGRLFENTTARDVMLPCPRLVSQDMELHVAARVFNGTGLPDLPVVDHNGTYVGLLPRAELDANTAQRSGWRATVRDSMTVDPPTVEEESTFSELMEYFMNESVSHELLVVLRRNHPVGLVYRSGLAALSQPLDTSSFAPTQGDPESAMFLAVPDVSGIAR